MFFECNGCGSAIGIMPCFCPKEQNNDIATIENEMNVMTKKIQQLLKGTSISNQEFCDTLLIKLNNL